jgi:enoyl-CoA hydratase
VPTIGAGFGHVGVCDFIFASTTASFSLTEINVGALGGASKALRMVRPFRARTVLLTGRAIPAAVLYRLGAVEELAEPGQAEATTLAFAAELAAKSPIGLRLAKELILRIETDEIERQFRTEQDYSNRLSSYADSAEARRAYLEKREPAWTWS